VIIRINPRARISLRAIYKSRPGIES
jgi:hypothetical protein